MGKEGNELTATIRFSWLAAVWSAAFRSCCHSFPVMTVCIPSQTMSQIIFSSFGCCCQVFCLNNENKLLIYLLNKIPEALPSLSISFPQIHMVSLLWVDIYAIAHVLCFGNSAVHSFICIFQVNKNNSGGEAGNSFTELRGSCFYNPKAIFFSLCCKHVWWSSRAQFWEAWSWQSELASSGNL